MKNIPKLLLVLLATTLVLSACVKDVGEPEEDEVDERAKLQEEAAEYLLEIVEKLEDGYIVSTVKGGTKLKIDISSLEEYTVYTEFNNIEVSYTCSVENGNTAEIAGFVMPFSEVDGVEESDYCPGKLADEFALFLDSEYAEDLIDEFDEYEFTDRRNYILIVDVYDIEMRVYKNGEKFILVDGEEEYTIEAR